jgi:hypothetical protein
MLCIVKLRLFWRVYTTKTSKETLSKSYYPSRSHVLAWCRYSKKNHFQKYTGNDRVQLVHSGFEEALPARTFCGGQKLSLSQNIGKSRGAGATPLKKVKFC